MESVLTHPLYLAPVPLYVRLYAADALVIDDVSPFVKQTYRSRAVIAAESGAQQLTIPVVHDGGRVAMRDVRISEHGNWRHQHWNAIVSAYRKSPFFEYYADDFAHFYEEKDGFLMDFNLRLHGVVCELLGLEREVKFLSHEAVDARALDVRNIAEYASVLVEITSSCDEYNTYERFPIWEYIVTLSDDLYFYPAELGDEFYWEEVSTDDLVLLYTHLLKHKDTLAR
jgi:hypothetical protein